MLRLNADQKTPKSLPCWNKRWATATTDQHEARLRGVLSRLDVISLKPPGEALRAVGIALVMKIGGAGPALGQPAHGDGQSDRPQPPTRVLRAELLPQASTWVQRAASRRRREDDARCPRPGASSVASRRCGRCARLLKTVSSAAATIPMLAAKGRASYLGERSIGHMDPGAPSKSAKSRSCSTLAASKRTARWRSNCRPRPMRKSRPVQFADR